MSTSGHRPLDALRKEPRRVKADPFVQLRLLDLQALDSSLARLQHKRRTLPELAEMERLDGLVEALRDGIVRAETEVSDLAREQAKFEKEIEQVRTRRERDEGRLASGLHHHRQAAAGPRARGDLAHAPAVRPRGRRARGHGAGGGRAGRARPADRPARGAPDRARRRRDAARRGRRRHRRRAGAHRPPSAPRSRPPCPRTCSRCTTASALPRAASVPARSVAGAAGGADWT